MGTIQDLAYQNRACLKSGCLAIHLGFNQPEIHPYNGSVVYSRIQAQQQRSHPAGAREKSSAKIHTLATLSF